MNYRGAMVLGSCTVLEGDDADRRAARDLRPPAPRSLGRHPPALAQGARGDPRARAPARRGQRQGQRPAARATTRRGPRPARCGAASCRSARCSATPVPDAAGAALPRPGLRRDVDLGDRGGYYRELSLWWDTLPDELAEASAPGAGRIVRRRRRHRGRRLHRPLDGLLPRRADPSLRIVVLEAETAGFGASGRNGGWASALFPASLAKVARRRRARRAIAPAATRCSTPSTRSVASRREEGIDCHFRKGGTIVLARTPVQLAARARRRSSSERSWGFGAEHYAFLDRRRGAGAARRHRRARRDVHPALRARSTRPAWCAASPSRSSDAASPSTRAPASPSIEPGVVRTEHGDGPRPSHRARHRGVDRAAARLRARDRAGLLAHARHRAAAGRGVGRDRAAPAARRSTTTAT